jgi:general secretion pathway protein A
MFVSFFKMREQPFGVTPDPRFLYLTAAHQEALASLYYGIETGRGFVALIAKPGMGKTSILFYLLDKFSASSHTAFLFQTQCNSREFMRFLLGELGYEGDKQDFVHMHDEFNKRLLQTARAGKRLIVVIDEAQNLRPEVLETVRLLSDFETPQAKLMQIVLAGQPELADKLASPELAQLLQRISSVQGLEPLPSWEIKNYIEHRLRIAGYQGNPLFTAEAYRTIAEFTGGIPRNVNNFCFNALSLACALRKSVVDSEVVHEVIHDLDIGKLSSDPPTESTGAQSQSSGSQNVFGDPSMTGTRGEISSPAEAAAYMQQIVLKLKNWRESSDKAGSGTRRGPGTPLSSDEEGS